MANNKAFKVKNGLELEAYSKAISDTAVDVFVYDTSKDSDGGAWRKRTQATSWYNETLNTATRGSRKEFPAVAVIVAEGDAGSDDVVTIYDGDDPSLPMWMVFTHTNQGTTLIGRGSLDPTCVFMLNGVLCVGSSDGGSTYGTLVVTDFLKDADQAPVYFSSKYKWTGNIADRNNSSQGIYPATGSTIVNQFVNDVAMTVLPNAPIDAATGLPVPTIAVATDGGWSQISDDGNVYDFAFSSNPTVDSIGFTGDKTAVFWTGDSNAWTNGRGYFLYPLLTSDKTSQTYNGHDGLTVLSVASTGNYPQTINNSNTYIAEYNNIGTNLGLVKVTSDLTDRESTLKSSNMGVHITSDYNTGWMNGEIKLATLSDTDDTDVTGSELVTNGDFATSSDWTTGSYWSIGSGVATKNAASGGTISQTLSLTSGALYVMSVDVTSYTSGDIQFYVDGTYYDVSDSTGIKTATFNAPDASVVIGVYGNSGSAFSVDNVSVRLAEEDRSVNGNGLQVFGTVTKDPVASGADLVGYSGFSTSNYLEQPYNSDLDFGTGDFCVMGWFKTTSTSTNMILDSRDASNTEGFYVFVNSSGNVVIGTRNVSTSTGEGTIVTNNGNWHHFSTVVKSSGTVMDVYVDGVLDTSTTVTARSITGSNDNMSIGIGYQGSFAFAGSLALLRISATAPSPEQIAKIYEDEKVLFQENAQATLYGSSDAVTALAYDDSTELLHVGTSAGRSVFQGLRRVDNTTTAVSAAISASNNLVGEQ